MNRDRATLARFGLLLCVAVGVLAAVGIAHGKPAARATNAIVVKLKPMNHSGVSGTATLSPMGEHVRIVVLLNKRVPGKLPAHLHIGLCRTQPNINIQESLKDVVKGRSVTVLAYTKWKDLRAGKFSIHVHRPDFLLLACGDVPRAS